MGVKSTTFSFSSEGAFAFVSLDKQSFLILTGMKLRELRRLSTRLSNEIKRRENKSR